MNKKLPFFLLRMTLGWLFFYAGITKVMDPSWSSVGYLSNAKTFSSFYGWLASPGLISITDFLNEWGLTLVGLALILGIWVRLASILGAVMMILYYFPILDFPYPNSHSFIVDDHIIYASAFLVLAFSKTEICGSLGEWLRKKRA